MIPGKGKVGSVVEALTKRIDRFMYDIDLAIAHGGWAKPLARRIKNGREKMVNPRKHGAQLDHYFQLIADCFLVGRPSWPVLLLPAPRKRVRDHGDGR